MVWIPVPPLPGTPVADYVPTEPNRTEPKPVTVAVPLDVCKTCKHIKRSIDQHINAGGYRSAGFCIDCQECRINAATKRHRKRQDQLASSEGSSGEPINIY